MKNRSLFIAAVVGAILSFLYINVGLPPTVQNYQVSPQTRTWDHGEVYRTSLVFAALAGFTAASSCAFIFRRPRAATLIWAAMIAMILLRTCIPGYPPPQRRPGAEIVFWSTLLIQAGLLLFAFRGLKATAAPPGNLCDPVMNDRYKGKPLIRLLECYVLRAIGELPPEHESNLNQMTPKLQSIYNTQGNWHQIIEGVMNLPADMPAQIIQLWVRNQELAKAGNEVLLPQHFAEMFVDQNLAG